LNEVEPIEKALGDPGLDAGQPPLEIENRTPIFPSPPGWCERSTASPMPCVSVKSWEWSASPAAMHPLGGIAADRHGRVDEKI
jgi:hypothetical protein